jgi:hypothetical protein
MKSLETAPKTVQCRNKWWISLIASHPTEHNRNH